MRPSVSIIGAGRVGTALGLALKTANYRVEIVVTRHRVSARRAATLIGPQTVGLAEAQLDRLSRSQVASFNRASLIIIATPDDSIAPSPNDSRPSSDSNQLDWPVAKSRRQLSRCIPVARF